MVNIVGWDDDYFMDNFWIKPSSKDTWFIRNSWGTSAHDSGY